MSGGSQAKILILDFGSQYTQVIARRVRECQVYSEIVRFDIPADEVEASGAQGLILSGGPASVYARTAPHPDRAIFDLGIPILGICYGMQLMAHQLGGKVQFSDRREYGSGELRVVARECPLFHGLGETLKIWNSHGDKLTRLPRGFRRVAETDNSEFAAIEHPKKKWYGLQ